MCNVSDGTFNRHYLFIYCIHCSTGKVPNYRTGVTNYKTLLRGKYKLQNKIK